MAETHTIATTVHGRYLVDRPRGDGPFPLLVGFHGYAERAEDMLEALQKIRGDRGWLLLSIQALNRFYTRSQAVVGNWMTREDRDLAIADNIDYVAAVISAVRQAHAAHPTLVYAGFSQGAAMAYRAAAFAADTAAHVPPAAGAIVLAGDVPPDVVAHLARLPPVLIGRGTQDEWYTEEKAAADLRLFADAHGIPQWHVFAGGHVWDDSFIAAAGRFLETVGMRPN